MAIWRAPDGIVVEAIVLDDRPLLRISQDIGGRLYLQGYCAGVSELAAHGVDLAQLVEDDRRTA
ncbi:hypothetical protein ACQEUU_16885 [Nonomuraea sp. CA-218870]|uniref:Uncharacterized protein n=1 Tax=Nonomuraea corallina TaxID=2989783 RepID=A0ABT4SDC2_9ACTN|nr:hypothetical protein [Nonomuraea corallina]MDA0635202.1 hypothetical protein [Nonomuraea corallina]